jgi:release factor glutamine methyltransferase
MLTLLEIIKRTTDFFSSRGIESPRLNAELLIGHALGLKRMQLYLQFERPLTEPELEKIRPLVRRRAQREPLQYIVGETDFSGLRLKVDRRALIPRPETELLIEKTVELCRQHPPARILDLGTGSGAIALALAAAFENSSVVAVDASDAALSLAMENGAANAPGARVQWLRSRWYDALPAGESFGLVISNPPYLSADETAQTQPEVRDFEPTSALASADNGLADLREIVRGAPRFLQPGGLLALETGIAQHAELTALLTETGFSDVVSAPDLTGRDRFMFARYGTAP